MSISFHQLRRLGVHVVWVVSVVAISGGDAMADVILAGDDNYKIQPSSISIFPVGHIPAHFFGPDSDPFEGNVCIEGNTTVERISDENLPTASIPIELVALNLVSCDPITVTRNGGQEPELWGLSIGLPGHGPTHTPAGGTLTVTKTHTNGGTFNVQPIFTFTRIDPPDQPATHTYSFYYDGIPAFDLNSTGDDWSNQNPDGIPPNASNFYPGATPGGTSVAPQTIALVDGPLLLDPRTGDPVAAGPGWVGNATAQT